jgi:N-acetylmuramoyl-L-alanine amidase
MRTIGNIVVHCTATQPDTRLDVIQHYWRKELGWKKPGYHYLIKRNGEVVRLLDERETANGVEGHNEHSIHIAYMGGIDKFGTPSDNRTLRQKEAMFSLLIMLCHKYKQARILGHRDIEGEATACPSFDVREWVTTYEPDLSYDIAA